MTRRERLRCVLHGGTADRIPVTMYQWLIPKTQAAQELQAAGLIPLGANWPFREIRKGYTVETQEYVEQGRKKTIKKIVTPVGTLTEKAGYDPTYGSRWISEHLIKTTDDYRALEFVYQHTELVPAYEEYVRQDKAMGENGIVLGGIMPVPVQYLLVELMGPEVWSEAVMLHTDAFDALHEVVAAQYRQKVEIAAASPAEVIWFDDNITGTMLSPAMYRKYCAPVYDQACRLLKQAGKLSFAHYDGANRPLAQEVARTDIDIIEAFTPPPMGDFSVAEARQAWPNKVLSLNFPGNLFREPPEVIEQYTREYIEQAGGQGGFVIGCTEDYDQTCLEKVFGTICKVTN